MAKTFATSRHSKAGMIASGEKTMREMSMDTPAVKKFGGAAKRKPAKGGPIGGMKAG